VEGLPQDPGAFGLGLLVIGLLVGVLYVAVVRRPLLASVGPSRGVGWIVIAVTATACGVVPFVAWRTIEDIRYTRAIDPWLSPRYGVSVLGVHPEIFDNAARLIPRRDRYYLAPSPAIGGTQQAAFREWSLGYLLPRVAVADPNDAGWILTLGVDPRKVGPPIQKTWLLKGPVNGLPAAYLGKVVAR